MRSTDAESVGEYALHIQCSWRIESKEAIVTGRSDLWMPAEPSLEIDFESWDYDNEESLQDKCLAELLARQELLVERVEADDYGGAVVWLSSGYRAAWFPAGTCSEDWRVFRPGLDEPHFVIVGGRIE